ncbi:MAG: PIN domain-containing protein [Phycisphaerales bacterium]|nr:MAG: PIN domain-containing protein [Phycisphaerales bacterium]
MLTALRIFFVLALAAVGWKLVELDPDTGGFWGRLGERKELVYLAFLGLAMIVIALDAFIPRKSLTILSGLFFGLMVGMIVAYGLSLVVDLIVGGPENVDAKILAPIKLAIGVICCYLAVSFILQTKDDVRFVIPYVEFAKQTKGRRPLILDTSVIIDGRIADIADTSIIDAEMIVPRFVLQEIQAVADSSDKLKRNRGRRGLDILNKLQVNDKVDIRIMDVQVSGGGRSVDEMLVDVATELGGHVVTNDYNLNKIAQLRGVTVINVNDLANALRPVVLPGESLTVKVIKPGEELGQGVGYLEDGTMVVAEGGRDHIGETVELTVTSVLQTSAGRMIFGRSSAAGDVDRRRHRPARTST